MNKKLIFLLPILSGVLLIFSYPPYSIKFLLWLALVPLLIFINFDLTKKKIFWGGFLTGLIFSGVTTSWFLLASMADWVGTEKKIFIILILASTWLFYIIFASLFYGTVTYLFSCLRSKNWFDVFLFPSLWIVFEYLRSWGLTIFTLGPGSLSGPHYTLGHLGYAAASSPFLFLAGFGGVYGLSFFIVFVNCLIFFFLVSFKKPFFSKRNFIKFGAVFLVIFLAFLAAHFQNTQNISDGRNKKSIPVTLIQTDFPSLFSYTHQQEKEFLDIKLNLFKQVAQEKNWPRIIVFPEHSNFLEKLDNFYPSFLFSETLTNQKKALIIDSGWHSSENTGAAVTRLIYLDFQTQRIINSYDKMLLMPVGDYLPYFFTAILNLTGHQDWIVNMEMSRGYEKGENLTVIEYDGVKIGGLICSEVISPYLYGGLARNGAEILISVASDAIFKGDKLLLKQLLAIAQTRAVENNRYFIQAANQGNSFVIDNQGNVVVKTEKIGNEVVSAEVRALTDRTFYNRFGDWILILAGLIISSAILVKTGFPFRR
jgi:apolipoprotein N-acyltransferase